LRFLLTNHGRLMRSFASGQTFLDEAPGLEAGPVLLDVEMQGLDGMEVLHRLAAMGSGLPVVILTGHGDMAMAVKAMREGAVDFLTKPFAHADLFEVLGRAEAKIIGGLVLARQRRLAHAQLALLTPRERQVLNELARGLPNKSIGYDFSISPRTVEVHRANIMRKLGVHCFPTALRIAFAAGMPFPADYSPLADGGPGRGQDEASPMQAIQGEFTDFGIAQRCCGRGGD
jgi:two-component system response regulator FixJ